MKVQLESAHHVFDSWAQVYDDEPNALLRLEDRIAPQLLPDLAGKRILDIGCGTGRWLQRFETLNPLSLAGVDCSAAMLQRAARKLSHTTALHLGNCSVLPFADASFDFILCSFTLSYTEDITSFARECARALAPGGVLLLSDMHPVTAAERHWKRSFRIDSDTIEIATYPHCLSEVSSALAGCGLYTTALEEPAFSTGERELFERAGRRSDYVSLLGTPAIYLMRLQKTSRTLLKNMQWSCSHSEWNTGHLLLQDAHIAMPSDAGEKDIAHLDLSGYALLPGLINAHDHLEFALFPNLGRAADEAPYNNAAEWAREIHGRHADVIAQHRRVPLKTRLWWGAIRNLLCGVTTVCHHNPLHPELTDPAYPIRVVTRFGWAHSLAFEPDLTQRFHRTPSDRPFILHAAEGIDAQSHGELSVLAQQRLLDERTVLVHGLALSDEDTALINDSGASLILCPTSNRFLFHRTVPESTISVVRRVALGSDSPLTAQGDLLDEICDLHRRQGIAPEVLYDMVTSAPANVLRLWQREGSIELGGPADIFAVRDRQHTPAETLAHLSFADVELVMIAGKVQVASEEIYKRLPCGQREGLQPLIVSGCLRYLRAPLAELFDTAEKHLGISHLRLGQKEVRCVAAL